MLVTRLMPDTSRKHAPRLAFGFLEDAGASSPALFLDFLPPATAYAMRTTVYEGGGHKGKIYKIVQGRVKISQRAKNGEETFLCILKPGDIFGDLNAFNSSLPFNEAEEAVAFAPDTQVVTVDARHYASSLNSRPELLLEAARQLAGRVRLTNERFFALRNQRGPERVASMLEYLGKTIGVQRPDGKVHLPITVTEFAQFVSLQREHVTRILGKLRKEKCPTVINYVISRNGKQYPHSRFHVTA